MKTAFLLFIPILLTFNTFAQYAGDGFFVTPVLCDTSDWFTDMLPNPDGSFYLVGGDTLQYKGSYDTIRNAVIAKYNADYTLAWRKEYGGSGWDGFEKIYPYLNGTMLVMGNTSSKDGDVPYGYQTTHDIWVIMIDSSGNILHGNSWGYGNSSHPVDLTVTKSGKIFITGSTAAFKGDFSSNTGPFLTLQPFVILADSQLNKIWVKVILDNVDNVPFCCTVKNDTLVYPLSIYTNSSGEFNFGTPKGGLSDVALFYIDTNQNILRKIRLGGSAFEGVTGIKSHGDSLVMLVSTNSMDGDFFSNDIPATNTSYDWLTVCNLKSNGQVSWNHSFGSFGTNSTFPTNTLYYFFSSTSQHLWSYGTVVGQDDGWIGNSPGMDPHSGFGDGMLWQFDTLGILKRKLRIGDIDDEGILFMKENKNKKAIIGVLTAEDGSPNNPFTCSVNKTLRSIRLFELTEWADATTQYAKGNGEIKLFPNPAKNEIMVDIDHANIVAQNFEVEIYSNEGRRIDKKTFSKSNFILDTSGFKDGNYYIRITIGYDVFSSKFIIQH